jgi:hypothetical protein
MDTSKNKPALTFAVYQGGVLLKRQTVTQDIVKIGRDARSHVQLECDLASKMHAVVEVTSPNDVTLIDLGNEPGTLVNGKRVEKQRLAVGDEIGIGTMQVKLEKIETGDAKAALVASAVPAPAFPSFKIANPFLPTPAAMAPVAAAQSSEALFGDYAMVKSGPEVSPEEVELLHVSTVEVKVSWGGNVLHVDHLTPPRSWVAGESGDYVMSRQTLGAERMPVVLSDGGSVRLVIPEGATGTLQVEGQAAIPLADLVASGRATPSATVAGAHEVELPGKAKALVTPRGTEVTFEVSTGNAGKPLDKGFFASLADSAHKHVGLSLLAHAAAIASLAFFMPHMGADDAEAMDRDQILLMQKYLAASAEREREQTDEQTADTPTDSSGGTGARAPGAEGEAGKQDAPKRDARFAVKKNDDGELRMSREREIDQIKNDGLVGLLASHYAFNDGLVNPWGGPSSNGEDAVNKAGNMWGSTIDDSFGYGLGLTGAGEGGGCRGQNCGLIGLGEVNTIGHGNGLKPGQGMGPGGWGVGAGPLKGAHPVKDITMRPQKTEVNGRIPEEVIQRIVRQNFGRFRLCYENGLRTNPALSGRVATKFVIGRDGSVMMAADGGSDLPDQAVVGCVVRSFSNLSFPAPEGGTVKVTYPIVFTPGDS